ncbi:MAG: metalloregulator ArsR/SmtB family transcription factor [Terriglobia bacterium]
MPRSKTQREDMTRYARMLSAIGTESRLRILRLLLLAHPDGIVAGKIQEELKISPSNLSHHLEKLKHEGVISVTREHTFRRYRANTEALQELLTFLYVECCRGSSVIRPESIVHMSR